MNPKILAEVSVIIIVLNLGTHAVVGESFLEDFNSIPSGPLSERLVGPVTVSFATGTYVGTGFNVLDPFVGHASQLQPSRLLSDLDILLSFDIPLREFSILTDPATTEPGANPINVVALASDFSVLDQVTLPNDRLPQTRLTVQADAINMVALDFVPIPGTPDDEGFDDMMITPIPEPSADFDQDGRIDGDDFLLWQIGFGTRTGAEHLFGDADFDGDVDGDDFLLWQVQFGPPPPGGIVELQADFDGDGVVDGDDFLLWQRGFGDFNGVNTIATKLDGDANGDGVVDGDDFLKWQAEFSPPTSGHQAVPEPQSACLLTLLAACLLTPMRFAPRGQRFWLV